MGTGMIQEMHLGTVYGNVYYQCIAAIQWPLYQAICMNLEYPPVILIDEPMRQTTVEGGNMNVVQMA